MFLVNINKDINKESYVKAYVGEVTCGSVGCLGNNIIKCEECIFADEYGDVIITPPISYTIEEMEKEGRVKR